MPVADGTHQPRDASALTRRIACGAVRVVLRLFFGLLALIVLAGVLLYLPPVQEFARSRVQAMLRERTGAEVTIGHIALRFPIGISINGLYVPDADGDTLLFAGGIKCRVSVSGLMHKHIGLWGLQLEDVRASMVQFADSSYNFDAIKSAFAGSGADTAAAHEPGGWSFAVEDVSLRDIHVNMDLRPAAFALDVALGELDLDMDRIDLDSAIYRLDELSVAHARITMAGPAGSTAPDSYPDLVAPFSGMYVSVGDLRIDNVLFAMKRTDTGDSLWMRSGSVEVRARSMDLAHQRIDLERLSLTGTQFGMLSHAVAPADTPAAPPPWLDRDDGFRYYLRDWDIKIEDVALADLDLWLDGATAPASGSSLDPHHITCTGLGLKAGHVVLSNTVVALDIEEAQALIGQQRTPLTFSGNISATPGQLQLTNGAFAFAGVAVQVQVDARPGDLSHAYREPLLVPFDLHAEGHIDAAAFTGVFPSPDQPWIRGLNMVHRLEWNTDLHGTLADLKEVKLDLDGADGSRIQLRGAVANAPGWPNASYQIDLERSVMGEGARAMLREYAPPNVPLPDRLEVVMHASGTPAHLAMDVDLASDLGAVRGKAEMKDWKNGIPNDLMIDLDLKGVQLARWLGDTAWGALSGHIAAEGHALMSADRHGRLEITPFAVRYHEHDMTGLHALVRVDRDSIFLDLGVASQPLELALTAQGSWPSLADSLSATFDLSVPHARSRELGLLDRTLDLEGAWNGQFAMDTSGYLRLAMHATKMLLSDSMENFKFQKFEALVHHSANNTHARILGDAFTLGYDANVPIGALISRFEREFSGPDTLHGTHVGERMALSVQVLRPDLFAGLLFPELQALEPARMSADYDGDRDAASALLELPFARYHDVAVKGARLEAKMVGRGLNASIAAQRVQRDSLYLDAPELTITTTPEAITAVFLTGGKEHPRNRIGCDMSRPPDTLSFHLHEDQLLDGRTWTAHADNMLRITSAGLDAHRFALSSEGSSVALETSASASGLHFADFPLRSLTSFISSADSTPPVSGMVNGAILIPRVNDRLASTRFTIEDFALLGSEIGTLEVTTEPRGKDHLAAHASLERSNNHLKADADIGMGTPTSVVADAEIDLKDVSFLLPFLSTVLYDLDGGLHGRAHYTLGGGGSSLDGDLSFDRTRVGVVATGAVYAVPQGTVHVDGTGVHFNQLQVLDSLGNVFALDGLVSLPGAGVPQAEVRLRTERFGLVHSAESKERMFFGDLYSSIDLGIKGPVTHPKISGNLGVLSGTNFTVVLPGSKVELVTSKGLVVFTDDLHAGATEIGSGSSGALRDSLNAQLAGMDLDIAIHVDKEAQFTLVIDPTSGDQATVRGAADLKLRYASGGNVDLSGTFEVEEGTYTLEFYGLVKKEFDLVKGSSLRWAGDPTSAEMKLTAHYVSNTAPLGLIQDAGTLSEGEQNRLQKPMPFEVLININGTMERPEVGFALDLEQRLRNTYPQVDQRLHELASPTNKDEQDRQVFGLLVFNTFLQTGGEKDASTASLVSSAATNSVNGKLAEQLNGLTGKYLKGFDVSVGLNTYDQNNAGQTSKRTSLDYKVTKHLFSERLSVEVGGTFNTQQANNDVRNVSTTNAAQYAILYDLTPDGRFRLRAFHEEAYDLYDGEITQGGIAIMLSHDMYGAARSRARAKALAASERPAGKEEQQPGGKDPGITPRAK